MTGDKPHTARQFADDLRAGRIRYAALVERLRAGDRLPKAMIHTVLELAGMRPEDLVRDVLTSDRPAARPGDPCDKCSGRMTVYHSKRKGDYLTRYLRCGVCGHRPQHNKQRLPGAFVPQRRRRRGRT